MKFSNDTVLNNEIIAHRQKMADRIERAGPAITGMAIKGAAIPCKTMMGMTATAAAHGVAWLRAGTKGTPAREPGECVR